MDARFAQVVRFNSVNSSQCVAVCGSVWHCVAVCGSVGCSVWQCVGRRVWQWAASAAARAPSAACSLRIWPLWRQVVIVGRPATLSFEALQRLFSGMHRIRVIGKGSTPGQRRRARCKGEGDWPQRGGSPGLQDTRTGSLPGTPMPGMNCQGMGASDQLEEVEHLLLEQPSVQCVGPGAQRL